MWDRIPNLRLLIVGVGGKDKNKILSDALNLGIDDITEIIDWQPFNTINSYVLASNICLVPHNNFEHTQTTIPHKLFQYMICGKPVLVRNCRPLSRIIDDTRAGLIFESNNCQSLASQLLFIYRYPDKATKMGVNGKSAALGKYAWKHDAKRLIEMYKYI